MIRVDGELKVAQDWQLVAFNVMREDQLQADLSSYQEYVVSFVEHFINNLPADDTDYPNSSTDDTILLDNFFGGGIDDSIEGETTYQARGIYIDSLNPDLLDCMQKRQGGDNDVEPTFCSPAEGNVLDITPFFEVNLSSLVNWEFNGLVESEPGTYSPDSDANALNLTASIEQSNTGFLPDTGAVALDDEIVESEQLVLTEEGRPDGVWRLAGTIDVTRQADFATPAGVTIQAVAQVDGSNQMQCTKPVDDMFQCDISQSDVNDGTGMGRITFVVGNYVKSGFNNQGDPITQDNKVCYQTDLSAVKVEVVNSGATSEKTGFTFPASDATDPAVLDNTFNIVIQEGSRACPSGFTDVSTAVVVM